MSFSRGRGDQGLAGRVSAANRGGKRRNLTITLSSTVYRCSDCMDTGKVKRRGRRDHYVPCKCGQVPPKD